MHDDVPSEIIRMEADSVYLQSTEKRRGNLERSPPKALVEILDRSNGFLLGQMRADVDKLEKEKSRWKPYQLTSR